MKKVVEEFGQSAGKVWQAINVHGALDENSLRKMSRLSEKKLYPAIGWLARENKIFKNDNCFFLGDTNLTDKIGADAGKIWNVLNQFGEKDVTAIVRQVQIDEKDAYTALGWLAREDKIEARVTRSKKQQIKYKVK